MVFLDLARQTPTKYLTMQTLAILDVENSNKGTTMKNSSGVFGLECKTKTMYSMLSDRRRIWLVILDYIEE